MAMTKLLKLKKWLTLDEAVNHISSVLGEPVKVADLYRFALDGHLILSADFVNGVRVRKGQWVNFKDVELELITPLVDTGDGRLIGIPKNGEFIVDSERCIRFEKYITTVDGIWDLAMIGSERLDIEHNYQHLVSGPDVTNVCLGGAFIQKDNVVCQVQESVDENEYMEGSKAWIRKIEDYLANKKIKKKIAKSMRERCSSEREKFIENKKNRPAIENYYEADLDVDDFIIVIRTNEVTRFIQTLEQTSVNEKPLSATERNTLLVLIGAMCKELKIDPNQRGVAGSLVAMTENLGASLSDDTIRSILKQIEDAVSSRSK